MSISITTELQNHLKGKIDFTQHSLDILNKLVCISKEFGKPLRFTSSFRDPKQNRLCGGSPTSSHLKGLAFDVICETSSDRFKLMQTLLGLQIKRIGVYNRFIHFDFDSSKVQNVIWYE